MSTESTSCPQCKSPYSYSNGMLMVCPECNHEWNPEDKEIEDTFSDEIVVKDSNGTILQNGDAVILIKDLPVKGAPKPLKAGTKIRNIKLTNGDHNIDCRIDGLGAMALKSQFVRKA